MSKTPKRGAGRKSLTPAEKEARKAMLASEGKDAKFVRLAKPRMTKALNAIRQIGTLSGPGYSYTPEQTAKMANALTGAIEDAFARFVKTGSSEKPAFDF